jgi:hypothetical protein
MLKYYIKSYFLSKSKRNFHRYSNAIIASQNVKISEEIVTAYYEILTYS